MPKPPSPAQRAAQLTFLLKGHLKNARIAYIRAAVALARIRDEKMWQALRHPSMADYAWKQLKLKETTLYRYLHVHDWLKKSHPAWLRARPKGFIPELTDVESLEWIEKRLDESAADAPMREALARARRKALDGTLTDREFRALQRQGRHAETPLRALLTRTRALRAAAARVADTPPAAVAAYDAAIRALESALGGTRSIARLAGLRRVTLARLAERAADSVHV